MQYHSSVYDSALIALTWHGEVHTMTYFVAVVDVTIRINKLNKYTNKINIHIYVLP